VKNLAVARRYAKALLLIGKENGQADAYREELNGFATMVTDNLTLKQTLENPLYDAADRKRVLQKLIEKLELSIVMKSFLSLIFDKGRIGFHGSIKTQLLNMRESLKRGESV